MIFRELEVLELSSVLAGPLVGSFFSELGANVTKVESRSRGGDVTRFWLHSDEINKDKSDYYIAANAFKNEVFLDLNTDDGQESLKALVSKSQIVISNFLPQTASKLQCTFKDIRDINQDVIMVTLTSFGKDDERPGFDLLMQASCGYLSMNGTKEVPAKMPTAMVDILAAHQMKEAVLIALLQKANGMRGAIEINVSLYDSGLTGLINQGSSYLNSKIVAKPLGTLHPSIAPYGDFFTSRDNVQFTLAVGSDLQFERLGKTLTLKKDDMIYFCKNIARVKNRELLRRVLQSKFDLMLWSSIVDKLESDGIPYSPIKGIDEVCLSPQSQSMINTTKDGYRRFSDLAFEIINHED